MEKSNQPCSSNVLGKYDTTVKERKKKISYKLEQSVDGLQDCISI